MSIFNNGRKAYLLLADGTVFEGISFGKEGTAIGEVVFSTGMTGYQETLTDPSYYGQIVTQTFPLIGNYGVNDKDYESDKSYVSGYIVREWCNTPSNFRSTGNINEFLKNQNIVGIHSIDTRCLTRIIRETGVMNGIITTENVYEKKDEFLKQINEFKVFAAVNYVTCDDIKTYGSEGSKYKVVMFDFGCKKSMVNALVDRGCEVFLVPAKTDAQKIKEIAPDGIMLSNGPGNPDDNTEVIANLKEISQLGIPIFGICMGHQLFALANGATARKLKYGHRGANQPVIDKDLGKTFVTCQNHGYAVEMDSMDPECAVMSHVNANDGTCEGIRYKKIQAFTVQFHPEAHGGPEDTAYLFDKFIKMMENNKKEMN